MTQRSGGSEEAGLRRNEEVSPARLRRKGTVVQDSVLNPCSSRTPFTEVLRGPLCAPHSGRPSCPSLLARFPPRSRR